MQQGYFEKEFTLTPDYCDARAGLSPLGAFTIFQAIATEHAEKIGVGGAAMAKRGEFWLTVHSRIDFFSRAQLMQTLTAKTWPESCGEKSIRCFRSYSLRCGDALVAMGRTQWAILGPEQKVVPFGQSGFPQDFPFTGEAGILDAPTRFRDDFTDADLARSYIGNFFTRSVWVGYDEPKQLYAIRQVKQPGRTCYVADGSQGGGTNKTVSRSAYPFKAGSLPGDMGMRFRHGKQCNLLFVDGHAEGHDITWMLVNQLNHLFYN